MHLGGHLGADNDDEGSFGRKARGLKVTASELTDYIERVPRAFEADRSGRKLLRLDGAGDRAAAVLSG